MKIEQFYQYFGENGTFNSPVYLPGVPSYAYAMLIADEGKILTNGQRKEKNVVVLQSKMDEWSEVDE